MFISIHPLSYKNSAKQFLCNRRVTVPPERANRPPLFWQHRSYYNLKALHWQGFFSMISLATVYGVDCRNLKRTEVMRYEFLVQRLNVIWDILSHIADVHFYFSKVIFVDKTKNHPVFAGQDGFSKAILIGRPPLWAVVFFYAHFSKCFVLCQGKVASLQG